MQKHVHGNSATATSASKCTGNSATATKLQTPKNIKVQGAVSGNANFDGSTNVVINTTQSNIAVLTGRLNIVMEQGQKQISDGQVEINFPTGFNKDNTIIISIGVKNINNNFWGYGSITEYAGSYNASLIEKGVTFRANDMLLHLQCDGLNLGGNATATRTDTYEYKIVLMKVL